MIYDSKNYLYYCRLTPDRRMLFGGRAAFFPEKDQTIRRSAEILRRGMIEVYPLPCSGTNLKNPDRPIRRPSSFCALRNLVRLASRLPVYKFYEALGKLFEDWKREFGCQYVVPVPGHLAGKVSLSSKLVCGFIAKMFPWLQYPEELLFRKETVAAAHLAYHGQRLTPTEQFQSLGCSKTDLAGAGVILFDDVRATGNTSLACKWRLQEDAKCGKVARLFLARTFTGTDSE